MDERESGASPIVGQILIIALVCVAAIVAYTFFFQFPALENVPMVVVDITNTEKEIALFHKNGDALQQGTFYVTVNGNRMPDGNVNLSGGTYPWSPGERLIVTYPGKNTVGDVKLIYAGPSVSAVIASAYFGAFTPPKFSVSGIAGNIINGSWKTFTNQSVLEFNGESSTVTVPNSPEISPSSDQITYEAWAYPTDQQTAHVVHMGGWDDNYICQDKWQGWTGQIALANGTKKNLESGKKPEVNTTWYHIVLTYNGSYLQLYVNGVKEKEEAVSGPLKNLSSYDLIIGSTDPSTTQKYFKGYIANVAVYQRALTAEEIATHYATNSPGSPT